MKRLSFKQIQQKSELLQSTKSKIKGLRRKQITKVWEGYRKKKFVIEELPKYRKKLLRVSGEKKEILKQQYQDKKVIATKQLEYGDLIVVKKKKGKVSKIDNFTRDTNLYKVRHDNRLDETVDKIFVNPKVKYVLITLKIRLKETGQVMFVSDSYTPDSWEDLKGSDEYGDIEQFAMENILNKLSFVAKYDGFELIGTFIKVIYATPTNTGNKEKHRKNKR
jgi:hypothetical protein